MVEHLDSYDGWPWPLYTHFFWLENGGQTGLAVDDITAVETFLANGDIPTAVKRLRDLRAYRSQPVVTISRFAPGDHFYVLDSKFDSAEEARAHATQKGYRVEPSILNRWVYKRDGD